MADGNYRFLTDKNASDELKNWIQRGGRLIAIENAVLQLSSIEWAINKKVEDKKEDEKDKENDIEPNPELLNPRYASCIVLLPCT